MDWQRYSNPRAPRFERCFDRKKIRRFRHLIPFAYNAMQQVTGNSTSKWPARIECMSPEDVEEGRPYGAGHGLCIHSKPVRILINADMSASAIFANFIHEHLHFLRPDWSEAKVDRMTKIVYEYTRGSLQPWNKHESRPRV